MASLPNVVASAEVEPKICWICQQEDVDDIPENCVWKSPCPCSLTAHHSCLLEWISNEEAPKAGEFAINRRIKCPQCKAEIKIQRPRDYLVATVGAVQRVFKLMVVPVAGATVFSCVYSGLLVYGLNTMHIVFGTDEARKILFPSEPGFLGKPGMTGHMTDLINYFDPFLPPLRFSYALPLFITLPLIAPSLVLLRTRLADRAFALVLPWYFIYPINRNITWPPSPGLVFATIPYLRTTYNELYKYTFSDLEKKWELAVQRKPRPGETLEQIDAEARNGDHQAILELAFELGEEAIEEPPNPLHVQQVEDFVDAQRNLGVQMQALGPNQHVNRDANDHNHGVHEEPNDPAALNPGTNRHQFGLRGDAVGLEDEIQGEILEAMEFRDAHEPPHARLDAAPRVQEQAPAPEGNINDGHHDNWEIRHNISAHNVGSLIIGALFFPPVATIMGDILKYTLPSKVVTPTFTYSWRSKFANRGFLTERWGRTVLGGCLFVVLKDVVTLYCKWKKARDFGKRTVLDYVGKRNTR